MLFYIIIDPRSINRGLNEIAYRQGLESVLTLIAYQNGILGLDPERKISKEISDNINSYLNGEKGRNLLLLLEEILKSKSGKKRWVALHHWNNKILETENYKKMCQKGDFDTIFIDRVDKEDYSYDKISYFDEFNNFVCEQNKKARLFRDNGIPISDNSNERYIKKAFQRISSKTKKIQFYDYIIGRVKDYKLKNWYDGFEFILRGWKDSSPFLENGKLINGKKINVEIITKASANQKFREQNFAEIKNMIISLKRKFGQLCEFKLIMKLDQKNEFRARFMVTDQVVVEVRKGFDLFNKNKKFISNHLRWMNDNNEIRVINDLKDFKNEVVV